MVERIINHKPEKKKSTTGRGKHLMTLVLSQVQIYLVVTKAYQELEDIHTWKSRAEDNLVESTIL